MKRILILLISLMIYITAGIVVADNYSVSWKNAYHYAREKGITTADSIGNANMDGSITRIEMAKMISEFSINVLGLQPDKTKNCVFYDTSPDLDEQYNYGVTKVCQLGLMGIYNDGTKSDYFNPRKVVTRGEWATILSRAMTKANGENDIKNGDPFYKPHLEYLLSKGIVNSYDSPSPKSEEKRGDVMLMLYKADQKNTIVVKYVTGTTSLEAGQIYRNDYFGIQITSEGKNPRLVEIESLYDENTKSVYYEVGIYNYVQEKMGTISLLDLEEYEKNAKKYGVDGLLMPRKYLYVSEKGGFCDQQRENDGYLGYFGAFVYKTGKFIIRDAWWGYQELPFDDLSYDSIYHVIEQMPGIGDSYVEKQKIEKWRNNMSNVIWSLIRHKINFYLDNFYINGMSLGYQDSFDGETTSQQDKNGEIQKYEKLVQDTKNEISRVNKDLSKISDGLKVVGTGKVVTGQIIKLSSNDTYYDLYNGYKMSYDGYFPWLISDSVVKWNGKSGFSVYVFVPESIGNYKLMDEYKKEFSENAKLFGQTGYLMRVREYYFDLEGGCFEDSDDKGKTKKGYTICNSNYSFSVPWFPYENKKKHSVVETLLTREYFQNGIGHYFPIDV